MSETKVVKTACRNCHGGCGALVTVTDGVAVQIRVLAPPFDPAIGTYQLRALLCRISRNDDVTDADFDPGTSIVKQNVQR